MHFTSCLIALVATASLASSALVHYDFDIRWIMANPDGRLSRPVISVNGQWPGPTIRAKVGDTIQVNATNSLVNETMSLHWHGIHQYGTNGMDGPVGITQCGINPGQSFTYEFQIEQVGTYWWHSHAPGQYTDGLRGPLIIEDPNPPYHWDAEHVLTLSDWYHEQMPELLPVYLSPEKNPSGAEPIPYSALINEAPTTSFQMQPGKTCFFRVINMAAFSQVYVNLEDHELTIIEVDGVYTEPTPVKSIYVATAQRYGVLVKAKTDASRNYAFQASLDINAFDHTTSYLRENATGQLVYNTKASPARPHVIDDWGVIDDFNLVPQDRMPLLSGTPDQIITMDLNFSTINNQNRATWNDKTFIAPKVPSLATVMSAGEHAWNPEIYGSNTNAHVLPKMGGLVEVIINNYDDGQHPIHIHGRQVQIVSREANTNDKVSQAKYNPFPIRRDTWTLAASGRTIIRYISNNPGVWLFHCHMEWHVESGLSAILIELPDVVQKTLSMPGVDQLCPSQNVSTTGNAVGNTKNWLNLTGEITEPPMNYGALLPGHPLTSG